MTIRIGYSGSRRGMTTDQWESVIEIVINETDSDDPHVVAHHGCCVGGDAEFHDNVRRLIPARELTIVGHPGPGWPNGPLCARVICDEVSAVEPLLVRNQSIVNAVSADYADDREPGVMIAAPYEFMPQQRGGTWSTIRMALRALRAGRLRALYVVGRDGKLLDHTGWSA